MRELPAGWVWTTLGEIASPDKTSIRASESARPYLGLEHVEAQSMRVLGTRDSSSVKSVAKPFRPGSTLYARLRPYLNKVCFADFDGVASTEFMIFAPTSWLAPKYLLYLLNSPPFVAYANQNAEGIERPRISWSRMTEYSTGLPPMNEQRRIVAAIEEQLSRLDAADASLAAGLLRVEALRRKVLHALTVADGMRCVVGEVAEVQGGIQKQPKRRPTKNRYPFLRVANVLRGKLDLSDVHEIELFDGELERLALRSGDLLVVEGNGSPTQIGRSAMWRGEIDPCVHQNHLIRVRPGKSLDPHYLDLYWNAPETATRIASVASSTSGLYTLSSAKVRAVELVVPPLEEQHRIVAEVEERLSVIDAMRASIERAERRSASLRRSILARAFRGELVPQDPSDEPASVLLDRIRAAAR